jgi:hypothetical protein
MIRRCLVRPVCAGGLVLLGVLAGPASGNGMAVLLVGAGFVWGIVELFILSALLFTYGLSGIVHDIGAINEHDPWHRW